MQKNKTLTSLIGIDQPQDEQFKKLKISTLSNRPKRRIYSAR
jgi:hypothetical protein